MSKLMNRSYYKFAFVIAIFFQTLNLKFFGIDFFILEAPLMIWGVLILLYDGIKGRLNFKTYHVGLLLGYIFCLLLAVRANIDYATKASYITVMMQFLIFVLLYACPKDYAWIDIKKEMRVINKMTCILTFVASSISLLMFLFNITMTRNGTSIGLIGGDRLFGIYFNSNPASFLACISIVFSVMSIRNKAKCSSFYYVNGIVQFFFILLGNCRAAMIILFLMVFMAMYYTIFKRKQFSKPKKIIIACLAAIVFYFGTGLTQKALYIIPMLQGAEISDTGGRFQLDKVVKILSLVEDGTWKNRYEIYRSADEVSSSRLTLWATSYKLWKTSPIIGIGANTLQPMARELYPQAHVFEAPQVVHTHNVFIEALVTAGIAGFVCFLLFFMNSCITLIELTRKYSYTKSYFIILLMIFVLMSEFVGGMLDYGIFYTYSLSATLFWIYLGYLHWINQMPLLKLVQDSREYDFIDYDLEYIEFNRLKKDMIQDTSIHIISTDFVKEHICAVTIAVAVSFQNEKLSVFQYVGYFEVDHDIEHDQKLLDKYKDDMALEIYEIIKDDIEVLISDSRGKVLLPPVQHSLLKDA